MKAKILVIEDNLDVRENLVELLELDGYSILDASNGREGVQLAIQEKPDLILCDIMMPELDGYGVLKILSRNAELMHTPFMFLTAKADKSDIRKGMGLGADDYLTKPFNEVELLESIEIRLKKSSDLKAQLADSCPKDASFINRSKAQGAFQQFIQDAPVISFSKKDSIYHLGQYPRYFYYVEEGLLKDSYFSEFGKELIGHFYSRGDIFGYEDHLAGNKLSSSVSCISDVRLRYVPIESFKQFLYSNRDYLSIFMEHQVIQLQKDRFKLVDLAYASLREKVAKCLYVLKQEIFTEYDSIRLSRSDLAAYAGLAKETVIRTLSQLKSDNIISIEGQQIYILDDLQLQAVFK